MDETGEARRARELGADDTLVKPVRRRLLLETLSHLFGGGHADPAEVARTPERIRLDGCRVLAVEDNNVNQMVLRGILERSGCAVRIANHGAEALDILAGQSFDIVLMDCEMPVLDGLSATRALRERERAQGVGGPHQVVVALTAHAFPAERDRCLAAGMDDYLPKPIRAPDLLATLDRWWTRAAPIAATAASLITTSAAPSLDRAVIADLREAIGDITPVIEAALADLPQRLATLGCAVTDAVNDGIRAEAHALAGACGNLGAHEAARLAHALETLSRSGAPGGAPALFAALDAEIGRLLPALAALLEEETGAVSMA
jgi:CheY-like chemotaxis protein/HPt (histidine-containing phosphotransfer) domain-containing protein